MINFLLQPWTTPKILLTPLQEILIVAELLIVAGAVLLAAVLCLRGGKK